MVCLFTFRLQLQFTILLPGDGCVHEWLAETHTQ